MHGTLQRKVVPTFLHNSSGLELGFKAENYYIQCAKEVLYETFARSIDV